MGRGGREGLLGDDTWNTGPPRARAQLPIQFPKRQKTQEGAPSRPSQGRGKGEAATGPAGVFLVALEASTSQKPSHVPE